MKLTVDIPDDSIAQKVIWFLSCLQNNGVTFKQEQERQAIFENKPDNYWQDNWMTLVMTHEDSHIDDDDKLEQAHANWEKAE
jgi:hypothetical protein